MVELTPDEFEGIVNAAIDQVPERFVPMLENVVILVEADPPPEAPPDLLGLYDGVPLTEREAIPTGLPDLIFIYRNPTLRLCDSREEVAEEVLTTVMHEIGHLFGIEDDHLDELGWG